MTLPSPGRRARLGLAALTAALALGVYLLTLAPSVTLWDAGEFIAAAKVVGVPHPPGTPLWVMLAHVWGTLLPVGLFGWRLNLMTAVASAAGAGCFALIAWEALRRVPALAAEGGPRWLVPAGAVGAALAGAFTFTNWQNSNETEVYAIATCTIGLTCWLALRWREVRGTPAADRSLLLIVYLAGLSIGNHLLALLAGPAIVGALWMAQREAPAADPATRSRERATVAVVAGVWLLLIGVGLGSTALSLLGALAFLAAFAWAAGHGRTRFALVALAVALVGVTTYLFLYLRAGQHPILNEAQPDTWQSLLDVIRRKQYPPRGPFDDPTVRHGPGNPGRSLLLIGLQIANYFQYWAQQWSAGLTARVGVVAAATLYSVLGLLGSAAHRRADRTGWTLLGLLFLVTGLGLVGYMNFKPGFSLGYQWFPSFAQHEVRERDYFFVVSYVVWGIWAGMGVVLLARRAWDRIGGAGRIPAAGALLALTLLPVATNWAGASRARAPMSDLARDFAYDALNSVPPYGVLITFGDNDTFPLWYLQEAEGVRQDVTVFCLALAQTPWYLRQLRDRAVRPFDSTSAPAIWRDRAGPAPTTPLLNFTDEQIELVTSSLHPVDQATPVTLGPIAHVIPAGTVLAPNDVALLNLIALNLGHRPIVWSVSTGQSFLGLERYVVLRGLGYHLLTAPVDTTDAGILPASAAGIPVDIPTTTRLVRETFRWAHVDSMPERPTLEPQAEGILNNLAQPVLLLAVAADRAGDPAQALQYLILGGRLRPDPQVKEAITEMSRRAIGG
ncbi:MAG TPA: DUF2723 domain-containing protein [Gemmatimonadales bacterium]|nr:DUF2723 domain-containing protein [Gemmatimonadales bacterium]